MSEQEKIQLFENQKIRTAWDSEKEEWYFSIIDVIAVLVEAQDYDAARNYWKVAKLRMVEEGNQLVTNCNQLKMKSPKDGKKYATDVATTEELLRIIQSIPSKKAEPIKLWLAEVGRERIDETLDPELIAERLIATYERQGYSREWINQRLQSISVRKELTDEWRARGIEKGTEYAILTDELTKAWSGMTTRQYKDLKGIKKESLRDNMSTLELALNMVAEAATTAKQQKPVGFEESKKVTHAGGAAAKAAKDSIETTTGVPVITSKRASELNHLVTDMIETSARMVEEKKED